VVFKDIISQSSDVFETLYNSKDTIFGFMFCQVVQRH